MIAAVGIWAAVFLIWGISSAVPDRERRMRRLRRLPVWLAVAGIELAATLSASPHAWWLVAAIGIGALIPELVAIADARPGSWAIAAGTLAATYLLLPSDAVVWLPWLAAVIIIASPYAQPPRVTTVASLLYFGTLLPVSAAVVRQPTDLPQLFSLLTTIHISDIAAGLLGKSAGLFRGKVPFLGTHPFPRLSPGKTVVGFLGAGLCGSLVAVAVFFTPSVPWPRTATLGLLVAFSGALGDLAASKIKRVSGVKDFSATLGPHGGVCDRLDSLILGLTLHPLTSSWLTTN